MELQKSVELFVENVNVKVKHYYEASSSKLQVPKMEVKEGSKYYKLLLSKSCWGFISKYNGVHKGSVVKVGDLLMAAGWSSPAKHSRGNIIDGTAQYGVYGPVYLK